jgi:ATP-dependent Clp protease ATP-binding subunit ClpC
MRVLNISEEDKGSKKPTEYTLKEIEKLSRKLKRKLIGQDSAVDEVIKAVKLVNSGLEKSLSLFFIGPTGVGKTELARLLSTEYLGSKKKLLKINCGEYSGAHEYSKLIGSPPGYIGHNEKGILTEKAEESSEWVILFDEIEKAHPKFYDLLLNLLDEGSVTDSRGTVLDFSNSIILFTSNVGIHENVGKAQLGFGGATTEYNSVRTDIEKAYKDKFSPEFRNRLDGLVHFNQLTKEDAGKIAKIQLSKLPLYQSSKLTNYVITNSFSREYGARNIQRFIKNNISVKIADKILSGQRDVKFKALFNKNSFLDVSA